MKYFVIIEHWCIQCDVPLKIQVEVPTQYFIPPTPIVRHYSPTMHYVEIPSYE